MFKNTLFLIITTILFVVQVSAETATNMKDTAAAVKQPQEHVKTEKSGDPLDKFSREDILNRINGILSHNPQILGSLPEIQKDVKDGKVVFKIDDKEMESFSKDELIIILRKITPELIKIQQEQTRKQGEMLQRQNQQNMQIQMMIQRQGQMKPPAVYHPPAQQPSAASYRPPTSQPGPPKR